MFINRREQPDKALLPPSSITLIPIIPQRKTFESKAKLTCDTAISLFSTRTAEMSRFDTKGNESCWSADQKYSSNHSVHWFKTCSWYYYHRVYKSLKQYGFGKITKNPGKLFQELNLENVLGPICEKSW